MSQDYGENQRRSKQADQKEITADKCPKGIQHTGNRLDRDQLFTGELPFVGDLFSRSVKDETEAGKEPL